MKPIKISLETIKSLKPCLIRYNYFIEHNQYYNGDFSNLNNVPLEDVHWVLSRTLNTQEMLFYVNNTIVIKDQKMQDYWNLYQNIQCSVEAANAYCTLVKNPSSISLEYARFFGQYLIIKWHYQNKKTPIRDNILLLHYMRVIVNLNALF